MVSALRTTIFLTSITLLCHIFTASARRCPKCPRGQGAETQPGQTCHICKPCQTGQFSNVRSRDVCLRCKNCTTLRRKFDRVCEMEHDATCGDCIDGYYDRIGFLRGDGMKTHFPCKKCTAEDSYILDCRHSFNQRKPDQTSEDVKNQTESHKGNQEKHLDIFEKNVLTWLQDIKGNQQHMISQQEHIVRTLGRRDSFNIPQQLPDGVEFPLKDITSLEDIESRIENPAFKKTITSYLSSLGGVTTKKAVWVIMERLLSYELAEQIIWKSALRSGKTPFRNLKLKDVVVDAVVKSPLTHNVSHKEIVDAIKRWLHFVKNQMNTA